MSGFAGAREFLYSPASVFFEKAPAQSVTGFLLFAYTVQTADLSGKSKPDKRSRKKASANVPANVPNDKPEKQQNSKTTN